MHTPQRDPFRRPGVADEIEAQLQMQEERRGEAARLAKAEGDIARLATFVRWGIFGAGALAVVACLAAVAYFNDLVPHSSANAAPRPPEMPTTASPRFPGKHTLSPSPDQSPSSASIPGHTVPDRAPPAAVTPRVIESAPAASPATEPSPDAQATSFTTGTAALVPSLSLNSIAPPSLPRTAPGGIEYAIKGALLAKFREFVSWPQKASLAADGYFTIAILGEDLFGDALEQRGARIRRSRRRAEDLHDAQIIFISKSERARIPAILDSFAGANVLTVGETEGFAKQGGVIEFTLEGGKVRIAINRSAAERAGLQIDPRLLQLAVRVID